MPSTFTNNGGIELPADGEKDGVWGDVVNLNMQIVDRLTNGVGAVSLAGTTHTLTTANGVLSDGQYALVVFGGSPTGTNTVTISPNDAEKVLFIRNTTAQSVIMTQGSGGDVTIPSGAGAIVYANGAGTGAAVADLTATLVFSLTQAGITATPAELNILDGATLSTAELNYVDGVTSAIQTQLNAKQATITGAATTIASDDLTASRALVSDGSGKVAVSSVTAAELAVLDGITTSTVELNRVAGVTSPIQTQLDTKAPLASPALTGTPTGPTAAAATNTTQLATTAFVQQETPELTQVQVEDDTSTVFGQVSGQRLAQAGVVSFTDQEQQIGVGQTWQEVSRSDNVIYQNTTGRPIQVTFICDTTGTVGVEVSEDGVDFILLNSSNAASGTRSHTFVIIPVDYYYRPRGIYANYRELT